MKKRLNNKGLTLIEIIVTIALLGIIITPFMGFFITSQKVNNESEREYKSIQLAQQYMEEIKSMDTIADLTGYVYDNVNVTFNRILVEDGYTVDIKIKPATNYASPVDTIPYEATFTIGSNTDLSIEDEWIILAENKLLIKPTKIKIVFNASAKLNITNKITITSRAVELYIQSNNNDWEVNVNNINKGVNTKIYELKDVAASDILYVITIDVTKNGYTNKVEGTTIFK